jgi:hypothetical protein
MTARMVVVAIAGLAAALVAPPVGAVLGLLALVLVARARAAAPGLRVAMAAVAGLAVVLGVVVSIGAWVLRTEISEYRACAQGANTLIARQTCQDALDAALRERLGLEAWTR